MILDDICVGTGSYIIFRFLCYEKKKVCYAFSVLMIAQHVT